MNPPLGTSIRLFLADGTPDGLWVAEKSNWTDPVDFRAGQGTGVGVGVGVGVGDRTLGWRYPNSTSATPDCRGQQRIARRRFRLGHS